MRRCLAFVLLFLPLAAVRADALTVRDVIELSKANVGDEVLLALIEVDQPVFTLNTDTLKQLKESGVSDAVIIAMIHSGRTRPNAEPPNETPNRAPENQTLNPEPENQTSNPDPPNPEPRVIVIDHHDTPAPQTVYVPVAVPVVAAPGFNGRAERITRTVVADDGSLIRVREPLAPNCVKAEPVYWGNGGKRLPGTWAPPVQIVCR